METDDGGGDGGGGGGTGGVEGAESLARQFGRLGVGEQDELVARMRDALDGRVSAPEAAFYLDMFDWNLHKAVDYYLENGAAELYLNQRLQPMQPLRPPPAEAAPAALVMMVFPEETPPTSLPGAGVGWAWNVFNPGERRWPEGCTVRAVGEAIELSPEPVPSLGPGDAGRLAFSFTAPETAGAHRHQYRLCTKEGLPFGDSLWLSVIVEAEAPQSAHQHVASISDYNMC